MTSARLNGGLKMSKEKKLEKRGGMKPVRLWPGVALAGVQLIIRFFLPVLLPDALEIMMFGSLITGLLIFIWWAFFSRAARIERFGCIALCIAALVLTSFFLHDSIAQAGMGMMFPLLAIPVQGLVLVGWAVIRRFIPFRMRRLSLAAVILMSTGFWALIRTGGFNADVDHDFLWRWEKSPEELLLQSGGSAVQVNAAAVLPETEPEWPGFRGPHRDGIVRKAALVSENWTSSPPIELWRRPVGPGWSSFAVHGGLVYTQEQRGEEEMVSCYRLKTGEAVWQHADSARFWESNGGAGPRGTPTLHQGRVYTLGGTGIINALNASDGSVIWSRNGAEDTHTQAPYWGFSASPLICEDAVIAALAGSLISYDLESGRPRWVKPDTSFECYSSAHLYEQFDQKQILLQKEKGVISLSPEDGALVWEHAWKGFPIVQPAIADNGDLLISVDDRGGMRRISVRQAQNGWQVDSLWTSAGIKPYFNDSAVHKGCVYGFDGPFLACMDIRDGSKKWRGRTRYGRGQLVLLADQDLILVLSEKGDIALVKASPDHFTELARMPALNGKTWNHPVVVDDILLVRNAQEMAAFRLPLATILE